MADDNFASIVNAVEEGRRIYDKHPKNGSVFTLIQFKRSYHNFYRNGHELPDIYTVHILWINLVTDSLPAIALGTEAAEPDVMGKPPRAVSEGIFSGGLGLDVLIQGGIIGILTLLSYFSGINTHRTSLG